MLDRCMAMGGGAHTDVVGGEVGFGQRLGCFSGVDDSIVDCMVVDRVEMTVAVG